MTVPRRRPAPRRRRARKKPGEGTVINAGGGSRAWSAIVAQVVKEEPMCRLRLPGCDMISETADHKQPRKYRPDLADKRFNLRGSCHWCNQSRKDKPLELVRAQMLADDSWKARKARRDHRRGLRGRGLPNQPRALDFFGGRE